MGFPGGSKVKSLSANAGDTDSIPDLEEPLEKEMAIHSSMLAWEKKKNSMDRGTWQATTHGTTKSWAQLSDLTKITNKLFSTFLYAPQRKYKIH